MDLACTNEKWVYQSNRFIEASFYLTTNEQKILRVLASMINKDDNDFKEYNFKVSDVAKLLGCNDKNAYRDLEKVSDLLTTRFIKIKSKEQPNEWESYHIIKKSKCKNGVFTLKIDDEMKDFYLSLKEYTKYQLKNIMEFKCSYTFRVYELLKQYEKIGERHFDIFSLKEILGIAKNEYVLYGDFKKRILEKSREEINDKSDISFEFEEIKEARKVVAIRFIISSKSTATNLLSAPDESKFINEFKNNYRGNLDLAILKKMIKKYGEEHIKNCLDTFSDYISGNVNGIEGLFIRHIEGKLQKPTAYRKPMQHLDFEQNNYKDEDFEKFIHTTKRNVQF